VKPSVGRIVHYVSHGSPVLADGSQAYTSECRAAVITEVPEGVASPQTLGLCVLNPTGQFFSRSIPQDDGYEMPLPSGLCDGHGRRGGTWHWPARTD
jgi:hypothetical protein